MLIKAIKKMKALQNVFIKIQNVHTARSKKHDRNNVAQRAPGAKRSRIDAIYKKIIRIFIL